MIGQIKITKAIGILIIASETISAKEAKS